MQNDPANTSTGNMARSSHSTDHAASSTTSHAMSGRYGFQGWLERRQAVGAGQHESTQAHGEHQRGAAAAGTPATAAVAMATRCSVNVDTNRAQPAPAEEPRRRATGARSSAARGGCPDRPAARCGRAGRAAAGAASRRPGRAGRSAARSSIGKYTRVVERARARWPSAPRRGPAAAAPVSSARERSRRHGSAFSTRSRPSRTGDWWCEPCVVGRARRGGRGTTRTTRSPSTRSSARAPSRARCAALVTSKYSDSP